MMDLPRFSTNLHGVPHRCGYRNTLVGLLLHTSLTGPWYLIPHWVSTSGDRIMVGLIVIILLKR